MYSSLQDVKNILLDVIPKAFDFYTIDNIKKSKIGLQLHVYHKICNCYSWVEFNHFIKRYNTNQTCIRCKDGHKYNMAVKSGKIIKPIIVELKYPTQKNRLIKPIKPMVVKIKSPIQINLYNLNSRPKNMSTGEYAIWRYLKKYSIDFIPQKSFPDCKYKNVLSFDFYLPKYKMCIEFQGIQHFRPIGFGSKDIQKTNNTFLESIHRDYIKYDYCKNKNIKLIYINFFEKDYTQAILDKNIPRIIKPYTIPSYNYPMYKKTKSSNGIYT